MKHIGYVVIGLLVIIFVGKYIGGTTPTMVTAVLVGVVLTKLLSRDNPAKAQAAQATASATLDSSSTDHMGTSPQIVNGRNAKSKICTCGAELSSQAESCPKCGIKFQQPRKSDEMFNCRHCGERLFKEDHWQYTTHSNASTSSQTPIGWTSHGSAGGTFNYAHDLSSTHVHRLVENPCPNCGEPHPFMSPKELKLRGNLHVVLRWVFIWSYAVAFAVALIGYNKYFWYLLPVLIIVAWLIPRLLNSVIKK